MFDQPMLHRGHGSLWRQSVGWLLVTVLYLIAAVLTTLLAVAMQAWWPLLLTISCLVATLRCIRTGFNQPPPPGPAPLPPARIRPHRPRTHPVTAEQPAAPLPADGIRQTG